MAKIQIIPGFTVEPGNCSLRVVTLDFLKSRGYNPETGYGFTEEMNERYGGKKLKLYTVHRVTFNSKGTDFSFSFSPPGKEDTYSWNEYMFKQYWDAIDATPKEIKTPNPTINKIVEDAALNEINALSRENASLKASVLTLSNRVNAIENLLSSFNLKSLRTNNVFLNNEIEKLNNLFNKIDSEQETNYEILNEVRQDLETVSEDVRNYTETFENEIAELKLEKKKGNSNFSKLIVLSSLMNNQKKEG